MAISWPGWVVAMAALARRVASVTRRPTAAVDSTSVERMQAWSITARLAALSIAEEAQASAAVVALISEARALHPQMAPQAPNEQLERGAYAP